MQSTYLKLATDDAHLVADLQLALKAQKDLLAKKEVVYSAVVHNFKVLKLLCREQQAESKQAMAFSVEQQKENQQLNYQLSVSRSLCQRQEEELMRLRQLEVQFSDNKEERLQLQMQIDEQSLKYRNKFKECLDC